MPNAPESSRITGPERPEHGAAVRTDVECANAMSPPVERGGDPGAAAAIASAAEVVGASQMSDAPESRRITGSERPEHGAAVRTDVECANAMSPPVERVGTQRVATALGGVVGECASAVHGSALAAAAFSVDEHTLGSAHAVKCVADSRVESTHTERAAVGSTVAE